MSQLPATGLPSSMDSGPVVGAADVTTSPCTHAATATRDKIAARHAAAVADAREGVQRAQAALATAQENLRRAQDAQKETQARIRRLEQSRPGAKPRFPLHWPAHKHA
jgi:hypothetical protein